ncbi:MAG: TrmH family RNA methyltransferase [Candidatus Nanopelagicales bacterium]
MPVGPHPPPWPSDPHLDPTLLAAGDARNVVDRYRYWRVDAIRADLRTRRSPLHVAIENVEHDLNIGSIVRTANAFNVAGVHIVGRRRWNRRGAMVTDAYLDIDHHRDIGDLLCWARESDLPVLAVDVVPAAVPIEGFVMPRACLLLFGQEGPGLSPAALTGAKRVLSISQHGSTRSMNVAAAAAIAMHCWASQHLPRGS